VRETVYVGEPFDMPEGRALRDPNVVGAEVAINAINAPDGMGLYLSRRNLARLLLANC
jgi:hypothetical protein